MASAKRRRKRANREARDEAANPLPELTDADLDELLVETKVRADCEHASTRSTDDGLVLIRCAVGAAVAGSCPVGCPKFEKRRVGGIGLGLGAG
ncbi:MAG: hypothetical protein ACT4PW_00865 [Acidimicrobiia bacterium]